MLTRCWKCVDTNKFLQMSRAVSLTHHHHLLLTYPTRLRVQAPSRPKQWLRQKGVELNKSLQIVIKSMVNLKTNKQVHLECNKHQQVVCRI